MLVPNDIITYIQRQMGQSVEYILIAYLTNRFGIGSDVAHCMIADLIAEGMLTRHEHGGWVIYRVV